MPTRRSIKSKTRPLLEVDQHAALNIVRQVMARPEAGGALTGFLFNFASRDQAGADAFCREVISAQTTTHSLLYLAAYVFGVFRPIGPEFQSAGYSVPQGFKPNPQLQRFYVQALLQRAQALLADPSIQAAASGAYRLSEPAQLSLGLSDLEPLLTQSLLSLVQPVSEARQGLASLVAAEHANSIQGVLQQRKQRDDDTFESRLAAAEQAKTPNDKDRLYAMAVINGIASASESELESAANKVGSYDLREQLLNWLYFKFAQNALDKNEFNRAAKYLEKVTVMEHRAYLHYELASALLDKLNDRVRAAESLQAASKVAERAPDGNEKARVFLGLASVYARFDRLMAFESLRAAVKTINQLKEPNVQSMNFFQNIEGKTFKHLAMYHVRGFDLNQVFQVLGKADFEQSLSAAHELEEKTLRAAATIALCADCLSQPPPKPAPAKTAAPVKQN